MENPFKYGGVVRGAYFADRKSETNELKHGIGPSSSIKASLDSLLKKGILYRTLEGSYRFADLFMPYWIDYIRKHIR
jgi:hypothetical protein